MPSGQDIEHDIIRKMPIGTEFVHDGRTYHVTNVGKPGSPLGEPKTDVYIAAEDDGGGILELKVSCKKSNARFLENKMTAERAGEIFHDNERLVDACHRIEPSICARQKVFEERIGRSEPGFTLGWRCDLMLGKSGELSVPINATHDELMEIYSGASLPSEKRDAYVNDRRVDGSGVANQYYEADDVPDDPQAIVDRLVPLERHVKETEPQVYVAFKAVNYRSEKGKFEHRPLAITCSYRTDEDGNLRSYVDCSHPFRNTSQDVWDATKKTLAEDGIGSFDDFKRHVNAQTDISMDAEGADIEIPHRESTRRAPRRRKAYKTREDGAIWVDSYVRSDGTIVHGFWRKRRSS